MPFDFPISSPGGPTCHIPYNPQTLTLPASVSVQSYHRWCHRPAGRLLVHSLIVLMTIQGLPLQELSRHFTWRLPPLLAPVSHGLGEWLGQDRAQADDDNTSTRPRITTITPECLERGATAAIAVTNFNATAVTVTIGGVSAPVLSRTNNSAGAPRKLVVRVPLTAPPGVAQLVVRHSSHQSASRTVRIKQPEICGNDIDDDCDDEESNEDDDDGDDDDDDDDDSGQCTPVNHAPVANAGADQTQPVGTPVQLNGTGSSDGDGNPLTFSWVLTSRPATSTATLSGAPTATPLFTIDKPGNYTVTLAVHDGQVSSAPDSVVISTVNSRPVARAGADQSGQVGTRITLEGSGSSDVDGDSLTYQWSLAKPTTSTATLSNPTSVTPSFTIDVFGDYTAALTVHDTANALQVGERPRSWAR